MCTEELLIILKPCDPLPNNGNSLALHCTKGESYENKRMWGKNDVTYSTRSPYGNGLKLKSQQRGVVKIELHPFCSVKMADDSRQQQNLQKQHRSTASVPQREAMMRMNYLYQVRKIHIGVFLYFTGFDCLGVKI